MMTFIVADAKQLPLAAASVDLVVTSPPYFGLRDYGSPGEIGAESHPQQYVSALIQATAEMVRVLKPRGSIFVNLGDTYAAYNANRGDGQLQTNAAQSRPALPRGLMGAGAVRNKSLMLIPERYWLACVDQLDLIVRAVIIWRKKPSMPGGRLRDRVRTVHEYWIHLTVRDRYYHDEAELRAMGLGQMPPSVWEAPTSSGGAHPAAFGRHWPERFIRGWYPPAGIVLDPFAGSGTTAYVAHAWGRRGISVDLSTAWIEAA